MTTTEKASGKLSWVSLSPACGERADVTGSLAFKVMRSKFLRFACAVAPP
jgi:hypothetical protein